ncbi:MAG: hypothetical protein WD669_08775 [Pirellulales bacterium]
MPDREREAAIAVLKSYDEKITAIIDMIGDSSGLTGSKKKIYNAETGKKIHSVNLRDQ